VAKTLLHSARRKLLPLFLVACLFRLGAFAAEDPATPPPDQADKAATTALNSLEDMISRGEVGWWTGKMDHLCAMAGNRPPLPRPPARRQPDHRPAGLPAIREPGQILTYFRGFSQEETEKTESLNPTIQSDHGWLISPEPSPNEGTKIVTTDGTDGHGWISFLIRVDS
jgi:hypothetical protein